MEPKIEVATIDDLKNIQELNLLLFKKEREEFDKTLNCEWPMSEDGEAYFKECITGEEKCAFVARLDDKIVGYLVGRTHKDKVFHRILPLLAGLDNMLVLEEYRGKGIGTRLYQSFKDWSKSKGIGKIQVLASIQNTDGINFYHQNGFVDYDLILESDI